MLNALVVSLQNALTANKKLFKRGTNAFPISTSPLTACRKSARLSRKDGCLLNRVSDGVYCCHPGYDKESDIGEYICSGFTMDRAERWVLRCDGSWCVLNKTVFLSREAAEDALKAGEK